MNISIQPPFFKWIKPAVKAHLYTALLKWATLGEFRELRLRLHPQLLSFHKASFQSYWCYSSFGVSQCKFQMVNVHVCSPDIPVSSEGCTIYTPVVWTHAFAVFISSGENSAFVRSEAAIANHYNSAFFVHQVSTPVGQAQVVWNDKFAWHLYTWPAQDLLILSLPPHPLGHMLPSSTLWRSIVIAWDIWLSTGTL